MTLEEWNATVLDMVQALWGTVSPNFRMVALDHDGTSWRTRIVLERDDARDRDEIEEFTAAFEALQDGPVDFVVDVEVWAGLLEWPKAPMRVVYRRREF